MKKLLLSNVLFVSIAVFVLSSTHVATFENETDGIQLSSDNPIWYGKQPLLSGINNWSSGDYTFYTYKDNLFSPVSYYYAFAVSNDTNRNSSGYEESYRSVSGGAYEGENFAVWSSDYYGSNGLFLAQPDTVPGFFVNNNAYTVYAMEKSYMGAKKFTQDDFLYLLCIGQLRDSITDTVSVQLADNGKYICQWTYVNLRPLGMVDTVKFAMVGSDNSQYGLNTPAYFCLDNFGQEKPMNYVIPDKADFTLKETNLSYLSSSPVSTSPKKFLLNNRLIIQINNASYNSLGQIIKK